MKLLPLILGVALAAPPPPNTCDPAAIELCLSQFEKRIASCDGDFVCRCEFVTRDGASCYAACPQEAMTKFIKTYSEGECATYDPKLDGRGDADQIKNWLNIDVSENRGSRKNPQRAGFSGPKANATLTGAPTRIDAVTVTAADPTTTQSLSPQEYQSRKEAERKRKNLQSIRASRERERLASVESERQLAATASPTNAANKGPVNELESGTAGSGKVAKQTKVKSGSQQLMVPLGAFMLVACSALIL